MPYAPFGNAIYGANETLFGIPPTVSNGTSIAVTPIGYDGLQLNWSPPGNSNWTEQVIVRSSSGVPTSIYEGVILIDESENPYSTQYLDTGLVPGRFYYYALFVYNTELGSYVFSSGAVGLVVSYYGFAENYVSWMPNWYLEQDENLATSTQSEGPLVRYLNLIGYEMDWIRTEIESLFTLTSANLISGNLLPYMAANLGMQYENQLGMSRSRVLVQNATYLYKNRGTVNGIEAAASAFSGFGAKVTTNQVASTSSPFNNLLIQLDDAAFDRSVGHWTPNAYSKISLAPYNSPSSSATPSVFPQPVHASYNPVSALSSLPNGLTPVNGYLPANNVNVALLEAGYPGGGNDWFEGPATNIEMRSGASLASIVVNSVTYNVLFGGVLNSSTKYLNDSYYWSNANFNWLSANPVPPSPPSGRNSAAMIYHQTQSTLVVFGGVNSLGYLSDTWIFSNNQWTQLQISGPSARAGAQVAYDSANNQIILFGGQTGSNTFVNDLWSFKKTGGSWVWTQLQAGTTNGTQTSTQPSGRTFAVFSQSNSSGVMVLYGGTAANNTYPYLTWTLSVNSSNVVSWASHSTNVNLYTFVSSTNLNQARTGCAFVYDPNTAKVFIFGGLSVNSSNSPVTYNDVWQATVSTSPSVSVTWTKVTTSGTTPTSRGFAVLLSTGSNQLTMFGGSALLGPNGSDYKTTYQFNTSNSTWSVYSTTTTLPVTMFFSAYASWSSVGYGFGGTTYTPSQTQSYSSQFYEFNSSGWLTPPYAKNPSFRAYAAFSGTSQTALLFGGLSKPTSAPAAATQDTWVLQASTSGSGLSFTWTQVTPSGTPPTARYGASIVTVGSSIYLFGGTDGTTAHNDVWKATISTSPSVSVTWTQVTPSGTPPTARYGSAISTDGGTNIYIFGGTNGSTISSDVWKFTTSTSSWSQLTSTSNPAPPARFYGSMVYDPLIAGSSTFVLFGGTGSNDTYFNDTWLGSPGPGGSTWIWTTAQLISGPATVSGTPAMAYNPQASSILFYNGDGESINHVSKPSSETWLFSTGPYYGPLSISTCNSSNASTLGIPIQGIPIDLENLSSTPQFEPSTAYVFSAYFMQYPVATPSTTVYLQLSIDWYGLNGVYLGSSYSNPVCPSASNWTMIYVSGTPPLGAYTFGCTVKTSSNSTPAIYDGSMWFMDAAQVEVSSASTPTPTSWKPPRDIQINLLPVRQNLVSNPQALGSQALGGPFAWAVASGTGSGIVSTASLATPPPVTFWPNQIVNGFYCTTTNVSPFVISFYTGASVNPGKTYVFSCYARPVSTPETVTLTVFYNGTSVSNSFAEVANEFTRGFVTLSVPETSVVGPAVLQISISGTSANEHHYVTGVMFEPETTTLNPYFDGNFASSSDFTYGADFIFEGTPNQSISNYYPAFNTKLVRLLEVMPDYVPIGATFSLITGTQAFANVGLNG